MQAINSIINTNINTPRTKELNTNIDIDNKSRKNSDIEGKARELCRKLGGDESRSLEFYCMAFHKLPEATVRRLAGLATDPGVRNKGAYFNTLVKREMCKA